MARRSSAFTSNTTKYAGVHRPQDALLDRLEDIHLDYYDRETEIAITAARVEDHDEETIEQVVDVVHELRDRLDLHVGTRAAVMIAEGLTVFGDDALIKVCVDVLGSKAESREEIEETREEIEDVV